MQPAGDQRNEGGMTVKIRINGEVKTERGERTWGEETVWR